MLFYFIHFWELGQFCCVAETMAFINAPYTIHLHCVLRSLNSKRHLFYMQVYGALTNASVSAVQQLGRDNLNRNSVDNFCDEYGIFRRI